MTDNNDDITLRDAQATVDNWITTVGVRYFSPLTNMAVLAEEVGEVARIMARRYGDQSFKEGERDTLGDELADVMWGCHGNCQSERYRPYRGIQGQSAQEERA